MIAALKDAHQRGRMKRLNAALPTSEWSRKLYNYWWFCLLLILGLTAAGACRHEQSGDPELEELIQQLSLSAAADAAGSCTATAEAGATVLTIRATSQTTITYCDLSNGSRIEPGASDVWDLSFQRFKAGTNSGTNGFGTAGGGACQTGTTNFASVTSLSAFSGTTAPDCPEFSTDTALSGAGAGGGSVAFNGSPALKDWYAYNIFTHALSAKGDVFIIRSSDGAKYYKMQMMDYYDAAGAAGYPKFRYAEITP